MDKVWWGQVPNALLFLTNVSESLLDERSLVLISSNGFPWHNYFVTQVIDNVMQRCSSKRFEDLHDVNNPGENLLRKYCKEEKRASYRPSKTYAKFFAESDDIVLHDRFFWVHLQDSLHLDPWMNFVSEYLRERPKDKDRAVFILDCPSEKVPNAKRGLQILSLDDCIGEYDRFVFCMLSSSGLKDNTPMKKYISELVANVVGNDIELYSETLKRYQDFLSDALSTISEIVCKIYKTDGSCFSFSKTPDEVNHDIWLSQIRIIYPVIESYREEFVKRYNSAIRKNLPISSSSGETYEQPEDVELGTLKYMCDNRQLFLSIEEYEKLKIHTKSRNKLSHLNVLDNNEVQYILS